MDPTPLFHCLFMLSCFGQPSPAACPLGFTCYEAPSDGITGSDALSLLCTNPNSLYFFAPQLYTKQLNTLVIGHTTIDSSLVNFPVPSQLRLVSLIFDHCTVNEPHEGRSLFQLLHRENLKYLTLLNSPINQLNWHSLKLFTQLEAIYIDGCSLAILDVTFASLTLPHLRILVIKSSQLHYIDREAFTGKETSIEKLVLADNQLCNLIALTSSRIFPKLWHLDVSDNQLKHIDINLTEHLPRLRELNLANNKFKYYSYQALAPWLAIDQFRLEGPASNTIFLTAEVVNLHTAIATTLASQHFPAFFLDSLESPRFKPPKGGLLPWREVENSLNNVYKYLPDNLFLNANGKLTIGKDVGSLAENIVGIDLLELTFDSVTTVEEYRHYRAQLMAQLEENNALRVALFSRRMFDYFLGDIIISEAELHLMVDLLVDCLDEAAHLKSTLLLVMWQSGQIDLEKSERLFAMSSVGSRSEQVLRMLMSRIAGHPALIGLEIWHGFLRGHIFELWFSPTESDCRITHRGILLEMQFIGQFYMWLKSRWPDKLYGVAMEPDCRLCLQVALLKRCRAECFQVGDPSLVDFDFITFTLPSSSGGAPSVAEGDEELGFAKIDKDHPLVKFNVRDDKNAVQSRGLWYVITEATTRRPDKVARLKQVASGYFVKNGRR